MKGYITQAKVSPKKINSKGEITTPKFAAITIVAELTTQEQCDAFMDIVDIIDEEVDIQIEARPRARQGEISFADEVVETVEKSVQDLKDQGVVSVSRGVDISEEQVVD